MCTIFLVDDSEEIRKCLSVMIQRTEERYIVYGFSSVSEAREKLDDLKPSVIVLDLMLKNGENGSDIFESFVENNCVVIVYSGMRLRPDEEAELIRRGATWVFNKPMDMKLIMTYIWRAEKLSRGVRLMKKAGRVSTNLLEETRNSILKLSEYVRNKKNDPATAKA